MILNIQDDILKLHMLGLLDNLLVDKTTKRCVMWATDAYTDLGPRYGRNEEVTPELITGSNASIIKTRARKEMEQQFSRTRQHGEVFTPLWVCKKMCDYADETWNGKASWQKYIDTRVLEITCGEAPFLASRYDVETGEVLPVSERIGLLDRKLRAVNENTRTEEEWLKWAFRAFGATYGYEFQGDNLLISRVNLLMTFEEYLWERWRRKPTRREHEKAANIIAWNIFQMDGLRGTIPYGTAEEELQEIDWFGMLDSDTEKETQPRCLVHNWTGGGSVEYLALPTRGKRAMKFDFVIGNPPYQEETEGTSDKPIYNFFMDGVFKIADKVELITPARFLFNAGKTPKAWNEKMLADRHFQVLYYEQNSGKIFSNTDIKGGVAITYRDATTDFGSIGAFSAYIELNSILKKVISQPNFETIDDLIVQQNKWNLEVLYRRHPEYRQKIGSGGTEKRLTTPIFSSLEVFRAEEQTGDIKILGLIDNKRYYRFIEPEYLDQNHASLFKYKVIVPASNGSGAIGEVLSTPLIGEPLIGYTQSFIGFGAFDTEYEAVAMCKYIKTKFARTLLGTLKVTQHNHKGTWRYVPLQDFTPASDIDWTKSISEIDRQLYKKYGLDETEIQFIETHVKEMT
ncbi:Eco57I restriction-modification methylase domain-containing protein [Oscillospiraceae bacterium 44-34]